MTGSFRYSIRGKKMWLEPKIHSEVKRLQIPYSMIEEQKRLLEKIGHHNPSYNKACDMLIARKLQERIGEKPL